MTLAMRTWPPTGVALLLGMAAWEISVRSPKGMAFCAERRGRQLGDGAQDLSGEIRGGMNGTTDHQR